MASDEIINSKSIEYADSRFSNLDVGDYVKFASMSSYSDGYTQGRADALAWKKYPDEKPKHDTRNAVFYRSTLSKYSENTQLNNHFEFYDWYDNCEKCLELWDHVERFIEVPGGEND